MATPHVAGILLFLDEPVEDCIAENAPHDDSNSIYPIASFEKSICAVINSGN